ncbi:RlmE family RNA methyltransferase [Halorhodospira halochloris]|nr:RlmE family RNA methyltransferase [Halorhodospira halochloris]MBK1652351.1 23S rRNA methyltransferase [Halorhodospira halochloris]
MSKVKGKQGAPAKKKCGSARRRAQHEADPYVQRARAEGWRSRAALKLEAMDKRDGIFSPAGVVVDLGAAPGGWSQLALKRVGKAGAVIAIDCLEMEPISGVEFIQDDFTEQSGLQAVEQALAGREVDVVLSDMAPNLSGHAAIDQPAAIYLAELAADFARQRLSKTGCFLVKMFQGEGFDQFRAQLLRDFNKVITRKPEASRSASRECYLLAREPVL